MTGATWMALLSVLLVSVGLSYSAMKKMSAPLPKYTKPEITSTAGRASESGNVIADEPKKKNDVRNWDALWKESLFKDDRTEIEATADGNAADAGSQEQVNSEFELVGIARMGRKEASAPVAIILEVKNNARNRQNNRNMPMNRRPGPGMGGGFPPRGNERPAPNKPAETEPENRKANKSLYRIGDKIGSTGYAIKNIVMEENKVILERGGVETVLILDEKNTNNSIRRERVKNEEMAVRAKYAQKTAEKPTETTAANPVPAQPQGNVPNNTPPQRGMPGQITMPNGIRPGMQAIQRNMQPAQRVMQPVQQNPTSGMPPLPPTLPGGAGNANGTGGTNNNSPRRVSPIPQRLVD